MHGRSFRTEFDTAIYDAMILGAKHVDCFVVVVIEWKGSLPTTLLRMLFHWLQGESPNHHHRWCTKQLTWSWSWRAYTIGRAFREKSELNCSKTIGTAYAHIYIYIIIYPHRTPAAGAVQGPGAEFLTITQRAQCVSACEEGFRALALSPHLFLFCANHCFWYKLKWFAFGNKDEGGRGGEGILC